jgi:hypothetical protein
MSSHSITRITISTFTAPTVTTATIATAATLTAIATASTATAVNTFTVEGIDIGIVDHVIRTLAVVVPTTKTPAAADSAEAI